MSERRTFSFMCFDQVDIILKLPDRSPRIFVTKWRVKFHLRTLHILSTSLDMKSPKARENY